MKPAVTKVLNGLLQSIQEKFQASPEWQEIEKKAYPPPPAEAKKKKVKKDKGSRYPGGKPVEAQPDGSVEGEKKQEVSVGKDVNEALQKLDLEGKAVGS